MVVMIDAMVEVITIVIQLVRSLADPVISISSMSIIIIIIIVVVNVQLITIIVILVLIYFSIPFLYQSDIPTTAL